MGMGFKVVLFSAVTLMIVAAADVALAQSQTCNPAVNPHSFACQHATFNGKVFSLIKLTPKALQGQWRSLIYTPGPQQAPLFSVRVSSKNPRIPVALLNPDGSSLGALAWPNDRHIQFFNFRAKGNHLKQSSALHMRDAGTAQVILANPREGSQELLTCRIFLRSRIQHLLCQWQRDQGRGFQFMGYLGWVR